MTTSRDAFQAMNEPDLDGTTPWDGFRVETEQKLTDRIDGDPILEARWMLEEATGTTGAELLDALSLPATVRGVAKLDVMVERRLAGEPIQYVLGHWSFRQLDLLVDKRVLIPRPETEVLVERSIVELDRLRPDGGGVVVDLGTGSGAIGLSIVAERAPSRAVLTDASEEALAVTRANLAGLGTRGSVVEIAHGSWFAALPADLEAKVHVLVSNPPYVSDDEVLPDAVHEWEPELALRAPLDGKADLLHLVEQAPQWLTPDGVLLLEMADAQVDDIAAAAQAVSFDVEPFLDLAGHRRGLIARRMKR